jgi:hypothetical protein
MSLRESHPEILISPAMKPFAPVTDLIIKVSALQELATSAAVYAVLALVTELPSAKLFAKRLRAKRANAELSVMNEGGIRPSHSFNREDLLSHLY